MWSICGSGVPPLHNSINEQWLCESIVTQIMTFAAVMMVIMMMIVFVCVGWLWRQFRIGGLGLCDKLGGKPNVGGPNATLGKTRDKSRQIGFATKRNVSGGAHKLYWCPALQRLSLFFWCQLFSTIDLLLNESAGLQNFKASSAIFGIIQIMLPVWMKWSLDFWAQTTMFSGK